MRSKFFLITSFALLTSIHAYSQTSTRYYRVYFNSKDGVPNDKILAPNSDLYNVALKNLSNRCLNRRLKLFSKDSLISAQDLSVSPAYLNELKNNGATIHQTSRWFNTAMIECDSLTILKIKNLEFIKQVIVAKTLRKNKDDWNLDKIISKNLQPETPRKTYLSPIISYCLSENYGVAKNQNELIKTSYAHELGVAGEDVLVGVIDEGFDPREHIALKNINIIAERDFVFHDDTVSDQENQTSSENHGTAVTSIIGGFNYFSGNKLIGIAPKAKFLLAKTEDSRFEKNVEEDNFVAALEWLEALGADVTNTSLGYTGFDEPETPHKHEDLDGHTAFASLGVNMATKFGMVCVVAAGNEFNHAYKYISVPGEADSAIAVAAVDVNKNVADFSSRGRSQWSRIKPNVAAMGVNCCAAKAYSTEAITCGNGTSYASPCVAGAVALMLSANPDLKPYEVRNLLQQNADQAQKPDTNVGYGVINLQKTFDKMSELRPIIGRPKYKFHHGLSVWTRVLDNTQSGLKTYYIKLTNLSQTDSVLAECVSTNSGVLLWYFPDTLDFIRKIANRDSFWVEFSYKNFTSSNSLQNVVLSRFMSINRENYEPNSLDDFYSTICFTPDFLDYFLTVNAFPNITNNFSRVSVFITPEYLNKVKFQIVNSIGQAVIDIDVKDKQGIITTNIDFTPFPSGVYFAQVTYSGQTNISRIVYIKK